VGDINYEILLDKVTSINDETKLYRFISWLEIELDKEFKEADYESRYPLSLLHTFLIQSIIAIGNKLLEDKDYDTIKKTIESAKKYLSDPSEKNGEAFFESSSNSYPYGIGEGCYAMRQLGFKGCELGSGCRTGAGTILCNGLEVNDVVEILKKEVLKHNDK